MAQASPPALTAVDWDAAGFEYLTSAGWDAFGPYASVQSRTSAVLASAPLTPLVSIAVTE